MAAGSSSRSIDTVSSLNSGLWRPPPKALSADRWVGLSDAGNPASNKDGACRLSGSSIPSRCAFAWSPASWRIRSSRSIRCAPAE